MRRQRLSALLAGTLLLANVACGEAPLAGDPADRQSGVEVDIGDLRQRVEFSDMTPRRGDTILITSTVTNQGAPREVSSRICGFDITLLLPPGNDVRCAGFSMRSILGAGESLVATELRVANLSTGSHDVRVRHLLDPEQWVVVRIAVSE